MYASIIKKKRRGLTLIETLLALGVAAVVIVSVVMFYASASGANATNAARGQIQAYVDGIRQVFSAHSTYVGLSNNSVIATGIAPRPAISGTDNLVNPWRRSTIIQPTDNDRSFTITFEGVPRDACVKLMTSGLLSGGGGIFEVGSSTSFTVEPTVEQALASCAQANDSIGNNLVITAR